MGTECGAFAASDRRLLEWLRDNGFEWCEEELELLHHDATGTSVRAKLSLAPNQVVARIPKARCLTRLTCHARTKELIRHLDVLGKERLGYDSHNLEVVCDFS
eukprot:1180533-Prorocentrum_minimum.AAC.3